MAPAHAHNNVTSTTHGRVTAQHRGRSQPLGRKTVPWRTNSAVEIKRAVRGRKLRRVGAGVDAVRPKAGLHSEGAAAGVPALKEVHVSESKNGEAFSCTAVTADDLDADVVDCEDLLDGVRRCFCQVADRHELASIAALLSSARQDAWLNERLCHLARPFGARIESLDDVLCALQGHPAERISWPMLRQYFTRAGFTNSSEQYLDSSDTSALSVLQSLLIGRYGCLEMVADQLHALSEKGKGTITFDAFVDFLSEAGCANAVVDGTLDEVFWQLDETGANSVSISKLLGMQAPSRSVTPNVSNDVTIDMCHTKRMNEIAPNVSHDVTTDMCYTKYQNNIASTTCTTDDAVTQPTALHESMASYNDRYNSDDENSCTSAKQAIDPVHWSFLKQVFEELAGDHVSAILTKQLLHHIRTRPDSCRGFALQRLLLLPFAEESRGASEKSNRCATLGQALEYIEAYGPASLTFAELCSLILDAAERQRPKLSELLHAKCGRKAQQSSAYQERHPTRAGIADLDIPDTQTSIIGNAATSGASGLHTCPYAADLDPAAAIRWASKVFDVDSTGMGWIYKQFVRCKQSQSAVTVLLDSFIHALRRRPESVAMLMTRPICSQRAPVSMPNDVSTKKEVWVDVLIDLSGLQEQEVSWSDVMEIICRRCGPKHAVAEDPGKTASRPRIFSQQRTENLSHCSQKHRFLEDYVSEAPELMPIPSREGLDGWQSCVEVSAPPRSLNVGQAAAGRLHPFLAEVASDVHELI